jgi:hypothetical protein
MTTEEIRNARKSFVAQLTSMIRDFERRQVRGSSDQR